MKNIALLTDFSSDAQKAYKAVSAMAIAKKASVHIYHQMAKTNPIGVGSNNIDHLAHVNAINENLRNEALEELKTLETSSLFKDLNTETHLLEFVDGANVEDLVARIEKDGVDLIVLGTSGHEDQKTSFADVVIESATIPVLVCKNKTDGFKPDRLLIPTDLETFNTRFFKVIDDLDHDDTKKTFLFVNTKKDFLSDDEIHSKFSFLQKKYKQENASLKVVNAHSAVKTILEEAMSNDYDFVCLATHGASWFSKLFNHSHAEKVSSESSIPSLVLNLNKYLDQMTESEGGSFRSGFTG